MKLNKRIITNLVILVAIVFLITIRINTKDEMIKFISDAINSVLIGILLQKIIDYINEYNIKLFIQRMLYYNKNIRVSFAYLYRIKIDGVYFLVKGSKIKKFQPVGGVYQYFDSAKSSIDGLFESTDKMKENTEHNQNDIRGYVKGKNLKKFISWFESRKNREVNCNREFIEELISTNILDEKTFAHLNYRYIGSHHKGIFKTDRQGYEYEYLIADIYELIPTDEQKEIFKELKKEFDKEINVDTLPYCFASKSEIKAKRLNKTDNLNHTDNIANHSYKILEEVENELQ